MPVHTVESIVRLLRINLARILILIDRPPNAACQRHLALVVRHPEHRVSREYPSRNRVPHRSRECVSSSIPSFVISFPDSYPLAYKKKVRRLVRKSAEEAFD